MGHLVGQAHLLRFRIAPFLVDEFESLQNVKQVKQLIEELSRSLVKAKKPVEVYKRVYKKTMERIERQNEADRALAKNVLLWLANTARLLNELELRCALAIEQGTNELDEDNACSVDLLLKVCGGLVVLDPGTGIIRLAHQTVQEYLDGLIGGDSHSSHMHIATTCLTYLCFDQHMGPDDEQVDDTEDDTELFRMAPGTFIYNTNASNGSTGSFLSGSIFGVSLLDGAEGDASEEKLTLLDYAANCWHLHARHCEKQILPLALQLLANHRLAANAFCNATSLWKQWPFLQVQQTGSSKATGLHLTAAVGLTHILRDLLVLLDKNNGLPPSIATALAQWPRLPVHEDKVKKMNADAGDDQRRTPLMWAAHGGYSEVVSLLLARNDVRSSKVCTSGNTALHYAARQGHAAVAKVILDHSKEEQIGWREAIRWGRDNFGQTALVLAALEGHKDVVELIGTSTPSLMQDLDKEVSFGLWPIHLAAQRRPASTMRLLIEEYKVDPDIVDPKGYSPLVVAADWDNFEVVQYFLRERKWDSERGRHQLFKAAFIAASNRKRLRILKLIVDEASDVLAYRDAYGRSLLEAAADAQNSEATLYLKSFAMRNARTVGDTDVNGATVSTELTAEQCLLNYIRSKILVDNKYRRSVFAPRFDPRRVNRILIYSGCFNPPHVGHLTFMEDSFINAGPDIKTACAFINPGLDDFLREVKYRSMKGSLILPRRTRARLWQSDRRFPSWAGVIEHEIYDDDSLHPNPPLLKLREYAAELGYTIEFSRLYSATTVEGLSVSEVSNHTSRYQSVLINTFGRQSEAIRGWDLGLSSIWRRVDAADTKIKIYQQDMHEEEPVLGRSLRVIHRQSEHKSMVSSTLIRRLCASRVKDENATADILEDIALSWDLLSKDPQLYEWQGKGRSAGDHETVNEGRAPLSIADIDSLRKAWNAERVTLDEFAKARRVQSPGAGSVVPI